ncbi:MAG: hypothetical protein GY696_17010, partial [Gammaproteobacteria bacterium]|nr:hypothetical protein [Gammaproteobacteria bacterium]
LDLANPTPFQEAALAALTITEKDKLRDLFSCSGRRGCDDSGWNPPGTTITSTLDHALQFCNDLFGDKFHPMDSDGPEEISHVAEKGQGRRNLVGKQRSPSATCDKSGKEDNKDVDPSRPSPLRDKKSSFCGIQGHSTGCSTLHPLRNSQTARLSTVLKHHPSADAAHEDGRIRCSVSLQPIPNISPLQRRQGPQEVQIWAGTGAEVSTLTEGVFRSHFPDDVIQPTTKIFKGFNGAHQPAISLSRLQSHIPPKRPMPSQSLNTAPGYSHS